MKIGGCCVSIPFSASLKFAVHLSALDGDISTSTLTPDPFLFPPSSSTFFFSYFSKRYKELFLRS
jgi:hypothetical protein